MTPRPEEHRQGSISIENLDEILKMDLKDADFGLQISHNRVWICINGIAFIRFRCRTVDNKPKDKNENHQTR